MTVKLLSQDAIQQTFDCELLTLLPKLGLSRADVAWSNAKFKPKPTKGFLRPFLLPALPQQATLGFPCFIRLGGIYQVSICRPKGEGLAVAREWKDVLLSAFHVGRVLVCWEQTITIDNAYDGTAQEEEDRLIIPVSISYYCYAPQQPDWAAIRHGR